MIEVGKWVTQYRKGYWQIVNILPKYAEEDYIYDNGIIQKKGELIGSWALLKKGFTPKMKYGLDFDVCDYSWCRVVSQEISERIELFFAEHPKEYSDFSTAAFMDKPAVSVTWIHLTEDEEKVFREVMKLLPPRFTRETSMNLFELHGLKNCFTKPPANYVFVCWHTLWELDENYDPLYKKPELNKV